MKHAKPQRHSSSEACPAGFDMDLHSSSETQHPSWAFTIRSSRSSRSFSSNFRAQTQSSTQARLSGPRPIWVFTGRSRRGRVRSECGQKQRRLGGAFKMQGDRRASPNTSIFPKKSAPSRFADVARSSARGSEARRYYQSQSEASAPGTVARKTDTCMHVNVDTQSLPTASLTRRPRHRRAPVCCARPRVWTSLRLSSSRGSFGHCGATPFCQRVLLALGWICDRAVRHSTPLPPFFARCDRFWIVFLLDLTAAAGNQRPVVPYIPSVSLPVDARCLRPHSPLTSHQYRPLLAHNTLQNRFVELSRTPRDTMVREA